MALNIPLPRQVLTHAHWTMNREKMSKSTGNVVNPLFAVERFGVDPIRYFLASDGPLASDSDYDNAFIIERYKKGLQWGLGNLTSRLVRPKKWSVRNSVSWAAQGSLPKPSDSDERHVKLLQEVRGRARAEMDNVNPRKAIDAIMNVIFEVRPLP